MAAVRPTHGTSSSSGLTDVDRMNVPAPASSTTTPATEAFPPVLLAQLVSRSSPTGTVSLDDIRSLLQGDARSGGGASNQAADPMHRSPAGRDRSATPPQERKLTRAASDAKKARCTAVLLCSRVAADLRVSNVWARIMDAIRSNPNVYIVCLSGQRVSCTSLLISFSKTLLAHAYLDKQHLSTLRSGRTVRTI